MATSRRRTAKKDVGQNLGELESRVKKVERRPRASIGSFSITSDLIAPGSITIDKLDPALLALLQDIADNAGSAGDSSEYIVSGGEDGDGLVTGVVDSVISQFDFSTTSASGKNSIYWQDTQPTGGEYTDGDLWYNTAPDPADPSGQPQYLAYRYNATSGLWEDAQLGDAAFRFVDAGKISTGILDAGIAIRVGTYPLDGAAVGKSRVEIASSFPMKVDGVDETFSGIQVLRKTAAGQTETGSGFYPTLRINADTGEFRVGGTEQYLSYNASTDRLLLTGKMVTGTGNESLTIGTDVTGITVTVTAASIVSNVATLTTSVAHGAVVGSTITVSNVSAVFNGTYTVTVVPSTTTLRYAKVSSNTSLTGLSGTLFVDGGDGIRLGPYNAWYRPSSIVSDSAPIFKVGSGKGDNAITVTKGGDVTIDGVVNPTAGTVKGRLNVRLGSGEAGDRFILGKDLTGLSGLSGDEFDGITLNSQNYWVLSATGRTAFLKIGSSTKSLSFSAADGLKLVGSDISMSGGGELRTADSNTRVIVNSNGIFGYKTGVTDPIFYIRASDGASSFEGETNPTGGTVKGKLTIQGTTYAFGKDVMSVRDGLFLNANNYWTLSQTGATAEFKVGGASRYLQWTGGQLNIRTDTLLIGDQTAATQAYADTAAGNAFSSINVLQSLNNSITGVSITSLGYIFSAGKTTYQSDTNGWFIGYNEPPFVQPRTPVMYIGNANQYVKWTGTALEVRAVNPSAGLAGFSLTGGTNPNILFGDENTFVQMDRDGFFFAGYPGLSGPNSVRGRFTIRQVYADSSVNFSLFGVNVTNYASTPIARIKIRDTAPTSSTSAGSIEILGNVSITGNLSVSGTGGGSSGGYSNATDGSASNKITYGGTAPTSNRTAGDIHIEF